jgi:hypothetical protein
MFVGQLFNQVYSTASINSGSCGSSGGFQLAADHLEEGQVMTERFSKHIATAKPVDETGLGTYAANRVTRLLANTQVRGVAKSSFDELPSSSSLVQVWISGRVSDDHGWGFDQRSILSRAPTLRSRVF